VALKDRGLDRTDKPKPAYPLQAMSEGDLLHMRAEIDAILGQTTLADIDVAKELMLQLRTVRLLQQETLSDPDTPANQKAQTANAFQSLLQQLIKLRTDLYNAERCRAIESMVIRAFTKCSGTDFDATPEARKALQEARDLFFAEYEELLSSVSTEE
jgi:hypothetical protein